VNISVVVEMLDIKESLFAMRNFRINLSSEIRLCRGKGQVVIRDWLSKSL